MYHNNSVKVGVQMKHCSCVPCDKEGKYPHFVNLGFGMLGEAWYCEDHLPTLDESKQNNQGGM